ncbi:MAG: zinc-binding dehydrogenase [Treponemataceae bacterium]
MKALMKIGKGPGSVELRDIPEPTPKANEIKVKIHAAGICGTDLHIVKDEYAADYPVVMGHEYSGTVEEVGAAVKDFKKGDRVVSLTAAVTCGHCRYCYSGLLMLCPERKSIGSGVNGAFAEYMVVPAHLAFKIPDSISMEEAALSEPFACIVRSVIEMASVKAGDIVLVSGPGTIGLITLQVAVASGAKVIVAGTTADAERMKLAQTLGAVKTINVETQDLFAEAAAYIGDKEGFDLVFECAGHWRSAENCLKAVKKSGQYIQIGLYGKKVEFDHDLALKNEVRILNSFAQERTSWERALRLFRLGMVNLKPLVSFTYPLEQWETAFEKAFNKEGFKILFKPNK